MAMSALKKRERVVTERREAVILFAELRNFTRMSEMLEPQKVLSLASEFFALVASAVGEQGGELLALHNDEQMAMFRSGNLATDARQAVTAAQRVQREFGALAETWEQQYGLRAAVSMGVHLGEAVFGMAGPAGAEQFVAFGDCVSIAERLVHRARAGEFVFSQAVMDALSAGGMQLDASDLPPIELARREPIEIYGVLLDTRLDFT
jgi:adenylate cyclase